MNETKSTQISNGAARVVKHAVKPHPGVRLARGATKAVSSSHNTGSNPVLDRVEFGGHNPETRQHKQMNDLWRLSLSQGANKVRSQKPSKLASQTAAYLFKYAKLTEWSHESEKRALRVAIIGDRGVERAFKQGYEGKAVRGLPMELVSVNDAKDLKNVDMLYIDRKHPRAEESLRAAKGKNILTVETPHGKQEPMAGISLIPKGERLQYALNITDIQRSRLKLNPHLVQVAPVRFTEGKDGKLVRR